MENKNIHIGIVGAGRKGSANYNLLSTLDANYRITIADIVEKRNWNNRL